MNTTDINRLIRWSVDTDGYKKEDERKCHLCDEPTTNKYCENEDCEVNQRDERGEKDD